MLHLATTANYSFRLAYLCGWWEFHHQQIFQRAVTTVDGYQYINYNTLSADMVIKYFSDANLAESTMRLYMAALRWDSLHTEQPLHPQLLRDIQDFIIQKS
jgi:hypothetical protein